MRPMKGEFSDRKKVGLEGMGCQYLIVGLLAPGAFWMYIEALNSVHRGAGITRGVSMKRGFFLWLLLLCACGSSSSTGPTTFVANALTIEGNPSIVGESAGTAENPPGLSP
jgi:hypothetical protein